MSTPLTNNTERIRELIQQIENLPDAGSGGVELPTLENPGAAEHLLQDKELINEAGVKVVGTMPNNGEVSRTMDGVNTKSVSIPAGYTSGGTVSLDDTIDNAVSDALAAITEKGVTVPAGTKVDGLADLIAAIEAGGGGTFALETHECFFGTIVSAAATESLAVNIGVAGLQTKKVTFGVIAIPDESVKTSGTTGPGIIFHTINYKNFKYYQSWTSYKNTGFLSYRNYGDTAKANTSNMNELLGSAQDDGTVTFNAVSSSILYGAGVPYFYFVFVEKGVDISQ